MRLGAKYTFQNASPHTSAECTDDSNVKEQKARHQQHFDLCDPWSEEALVRDEALLQWLRSVPFLKKVVAAAWMNKSWQSSLGEGFSKQTAHLSWI